MHTTLRPFPMSWALPQAVEYYGRSVDIGLSARRRSRSSLVSLVRPQVRRSVVRLVIPGPSGEGIDDDAVTVIVTPDRENSTIIL